MREREPGRGLPASERPPACPASGVLTAPESPRRKALKRIGPLALIAVIMAVCFGMGWHRALTLENIVAQRDEFQHVLGDHRALAVAIFVICYVCVTALSLPGGLVLTATGGLLFGWLVGGLAAVLGATIGATLVFLIARSAIGEGLAQRAAPWLEKLRAGFRDEALSYLLFLRLVPAFPFWFVNIAPAVLGVPLKTYVIATFFGIIPATFAFAAAGAGLDSVIAMAKAQYMACVAEKGAQACKLTIQKSSLVTKELLLALVLLGFVALIPIALKKWRKRNVAAQ